MATRRAILLTAMIFAAIAVSNTSPAYAQVLTQTWTTPPNVASSIVVSGAGDVDGDGFDDVLVADDVNGEVYLYRGSSAGVAGPATWSTSHSLFNAWNGLGQTVAGAGDINGDGYDDVIVGSVEQGSTGPTDPADGIVKVFYGSGSGLSSQPDWTASRVDRTFGNAVAGAGDLNGDGYDDVVVGDPGWCPYPNQNASGPKSAVYVYYGSGSGLPAQPSWSYEHSNNDEFVSCLGISVASAGDVDGDGFDDLIAGAPDYLNDGVGEGRAYLFNGSSSGLSDTPDWTSIHPKSVHGKQAGYGWNLLGVGDVDGDGYDDIMVGGYGTYQKGEGGGQTNMSYRLFFYHGGPNGVQPQPVWADPVGQRPYHRGTMSGDIDADGFSDIVFLLSRGGQPGAALAHGSSRGVIRDLAWTFRPAMLEQDYGRAIDIIGDVNGDGYDDVIVGRNGKPARVYHGGPNPPPDAQSASLTLLQGETKEIDLKATDRHDDPLTFSIETSPAEGTLSAFDLRNGVVDYTAPNSYTGQDSFTFEVEDLYGGTDTAAIDITVEAPNEAPTFVDPTPAGELNAQVGESISFTVAADDPNGDPLSYGATDLPDGAAFESQNRQFNWTPTPEQAPETYGINLTVDDGELSTMRTVNIVVEPRPMEDVGTDAGAGDPGPDVGMMDAAGPDAMSDAGPPPMDTGYASPTESGCGCSQSGEPSSPPMALLVGAILLMVTRRARGRSHSA